MQQPFEITRYRSWLAQTRGLRFDDHEAMWRWSTTELGAFWESIWQYGALQSPTPYSTPLADDRMPGAVWFPGARVNYARQVLRHADAADAAGMPAIVSSNEKGQYRELDWATLKRQVAAFALHLQAQGVVPGDRVVAYLPNVPETMVAFLAAASIGAVWSVCAPDMGVAAVLDRFRQIEPKVLIACDGITYGGKDIDRLDTVRELRAALPSLQNLVLVVNLRADAQLDNAERFDAICVRDDAATAAFEPLWLPFDHPLWIVYSSGTTGLPKAIVHGHGGIMLIGTGPARLHHDIGPSYAPESLGERFFWYSSTGWIMWNVQVNVLLLGITVLLYDGNPGGNPGGTREHPDWGVLWRFAARARATFFGAGAAYFSSCEKAGVDISTCGDLSAVRALGSTGSPLPANVQAWGTAAFGKLGVPDMWWCNISGGTDFAGAFVGGNRELPLIPGEIQCRILGCAVESWNEAGQSVVDEVGELVCTRPLPSMPLYFWGDEGNRRYLSSYFEEFPGVWRHGDWIRISARGSCVIYGRSDATINRHGLRMGTSEIYSAVEAVPEVLDALVVDLEYLGRDSFMPLFVVLRPGFVLDESVRGRINGAIRVALSPRFVPDEILQVADIPRTLSGKKQELPIKKLLLGHPLDKVLNRAAMANAECLDWYVDYARRRAAAV